MCWKYKRKLEKCAARLEYAYTCFSSTLTQLLNDIVPSDVDFQLMIAEPLGLLLEKLVCVCTRKAYTAKKCKHID